MPSKQLIPLEEVLEDMESEIGWVRESATQYFHKEYLNEIQVENPNRKWWQFWKPHLVWVKKQRGW